MRTSLSRGKRGFTLVELLVVIAIIGVLVALLLPAVQAAREAARRMSCGNNLKQIALACHNYQSTYKTLPWNWDPTWPDPAANTITNANNQAFSWLFAMLPFIEQQPLYDQTDKITPGGNWAPNNRVLRQTVIPAFICPSNNQPTNRLEQSEGYACGNCMGGYGQAAGTDYVGNMGHHWGGWRDCNQLPEFANPAGTRYFIRGGSTQLETPWVNGQWDVDQPRLQGLFQYRGTIRMDDALDGMSNTILAYEDMHWQGFNIGAGGGSGRPPNLVRTALGDTAWMSPLSAIGNMRNPINNRTAAWYGDHLSDPRCHGWSSNHPGGAQAAKVDGSVRFYPQTMDHVVRYAISTRANGETFQEPQ